MKNKHRHDKSEATESSPARRAGLWKPSKPQRSKDKRRVNTHDSSQIAQDWGAGTEAGLVETLATMGPEFALDFDGRKKLLDFMNNVIVGTVHVGSLTAGAPSRSEHLERLKQIEETALKLFGLLDINLSPEQAFDGNMYCASMNQNLWPVLRVGAHGQSCASEAAGDPPLPPDDKLLSCTVTAIAGMAIFARRAQRALPKRAKTTAPQEAHSIGMAWLYRDTFKKEPACGAGSPWLKFLKWGRKIAKLPELSDDRLRRLPVKPQNPPNMADVEKLAYYIRKNESPDPDFTALTTFVASMDAAIRAEIRAEMEKADLG